MVDWAFSVQLPPTQKLVLLALANCHNKGTGCCYPSIPHIAEVTGLNWRTVMRAVDGLQKRGAIAATKRGGQRTEYALMRDSYPCHRVTPDTVSPLSQSQGTPVTVSPLPLSQSHHTPVTESPKPGKNHISKEIKEPRYSRDDLISAEVMLAKIRDGYPGLRQPNLPAWAETLRKLREIDKRPPDEIGETFEWANAHDFWSRNILSPEALRRNYDKIRAQMIPRDSQHDLAFRRVFG